MKDHATFLAAAARLASLRADVYFVMVGRGVSLEEPALVEAIPAEYRARFRLLGERRDVAELMRAMDVFCLSSWSEAFPNVLIEAMASQLPCVTTDVGDAAYIVAETGAVVPPRDVNALASELLKVVSLPMKARELQGKTARERIERAFSLTAVVDDYSALYEACASRSS